MHRVNQYLLRQSIHVLPDEVVTSRMEKRGEAPRVSKSNEMGLARIKINIQDPELSDLLSCH